MAADIRSNYLDWLRSLVYDDTYAKENTYYKLFEQLYSTEFYWVIDHDENRAADGVMLRYEFADAYRYSYSEIEFIFADEPCSVLEMFIGLVMRCENAIAMDEDYGNRSGQWFWTIIVNLGLGEMTDSQYDEAIVGDILRTFMNREYKDNEIGCPFFVEHPRKPLRDTELWMQMNWFLADIL